MIDMADFSSTNRDASLPEWTEQLECIVETHSQPFDITESEIEEAYAAGKRVDNFFYEQWADY
jgi:hypothetical protein